MCDKLEALTQLHSVLCVLLFSYFSTVLYVNFHFLTKCRQIFKLYAHEI